MKRKTYSTCHKPIFFQKLDDLLSWSIGGNILKVQETPSKSVMLHVCLFTGKRIFCCVCHKTVNIYYLKLCTKVIKFTNGSTFMIIYTYNAV